MANLTSMRYPIGEFHFPEEVSDELFERWVKDIASLPNRILHVVDRLSVEQLNYRYRPDGWKIKQLVHHIADSHINYYVRLKLSLTEDSPTIQPYQESLWANLAGNIDDDLTDSVALSHALHARLSKLIKKLTSDQLQRTFVHPEANRIYTLQETVGLYAWHGNHHLAHIQQALTYKEQFEV